MRGKGKSSHDLLDDEKLSHVPAVEPTEMKRAHESGEVGLQLSMFLTTIYVNEIINENGTFKTCSEVRNGSEGTISFM